jgi:hypothetical protein
MAAGCGAAEEKPAPIPTDTRGAVFLQALADPENRTEAGAWNGMTEAQVVEQARAVCVDLVASMPLVDVWQAEMRRAQVGMMDADYFVRTAARLYCPAREREAMGA